MVFVAVERSARSSHTTQARRPSSPGTRTAPWPRASVSCCEATATSVVAPRLQRSAFGYLVRPPRPRVRRSSGEGGTGTFSLAGRKNISLRRRNSTAETMRAPNTPICARCWSPWAVQKVLGSTTDAQYSPDTQAIVGMLLERWAQLGQTIQTRSETARQRLVCTRPGPPASTKISVYQHSLWQV